MIMPNQRQFDTVIRNTALLLNKMLLETPKYLKLCFPASGMSNPSREDYLIDKILQSPAQETSVQPPLLCLLTKTRSYLHKATDDYTRSSLL